MSLFRRNCESTLLSGTQLAEAKALRDQASSQTNSLTGYLIKPGLAEGLTINDTQAQERAWSRLDRDMDQLTHGLYPVSRRRRRRAISLRETYLRQSLHNYRQVINGILATHGLPAVPREHLTPAGSS